MIEYAEKQHHVELAADLFDGQIRHINVERLDVQAEGRARKLERFTTTMLPAEMIGGENPVGATVLGLKRIDAIPRADIDDAYAVHTDRIEDRGGFFEVKLGGLESPRRDAVAEINRMQPGILLNLLSDINHVTLRAVIGRMYLSGDPKPRPRHNARVRSPGTHDPVIPAGVARHITKTYGISTAAQGAISLRPCQNSSSTLRLVLCLPIRADCFRTFEMASLGVTASPCPPLPPGRPADDSGPNLSNLGRFLSS